MRAGPGIIPARAGFTDHALRSGRRSWDHPRSRGVYAESALVVVSRAGSSPLARGLRPGYYWESDDPRIIPARAGFTLGVRLTGVNRRDHPRSRGVYQGPVGLPHPLRGSSPLARGLPVDLHVVGSAGRIIPARAGFTHSCGGWASAGADHPRSRGVYHVTVARSGTIWGSSPLARGLLAPRLRMHYGMRIIPARAGFTAAILRVPARHQDHPRSRGVYPPMRSRGPRGRGSSPLARGLHDEDAARLTEFGIIPARAGFTFAAGPGREAHQDHPRSRGVYLPACHSTFWFSWIIPARAGFTPTSAAPDRLSGDHPRSRGVY